MKEGPQLMGVIAASAVVGGLALSRALTTGGTVAWCVTTACGMITIFALVASVQYLRWVRSPDQRTAADAFFEHWPEELDVLVSDADEEIRAFAAAKLAQKAQWPNWCYHHDAIQVLRHVIKSPDCPAMVLASSLGALAEFTSEEAANFAWEIACDVRRPRYARMAAILTLARTGRHESGLKSLASASHQGTDIQFTALIAFYTAMPRMTAVQKSATVQWLAEYAHQPEIEAKLREFARCVAEGHQPDKEFFQSIAGEHAPDDVRAVGLVGLFQDASSQDELVMEELAKVNAQVRKAVASVLWPFRPAIRAALLQQLTART